MTTGADAPQLPKVGAVLGDRFELRAWLGDGGMGHVFRAYDRFAAREVALKLLAPRYLGRDERELRVAREAQLGQRARHRNLVEYFDHGRIGKLRWPFLTMELIDGPSLGIRLIDGGLAPRLAARFARQIAGAARALHESDVVHRDITSANVLLRGDDAVLIDLSHAGDLSAPRVPVGAPGRITRVNEVPGTHLYMDRDQANADPAEPSMDVYAFGVTLAHMLTGRAPRGYERAEFIQLQREGRIESPRIDSRVFPEIPPTLIELTHSCTDPVAGQRPAMDEIVTALDALLAAMVMPAVELTRPLEAANGPAMVAAELDREPDSTVPDDVPSQQAQPAQDGSRRLWFVLAMIAGALLAALLVAVVLRSIAGDPVESAATSAVQSSNAADGDEPEPPHAVGSTGPLPAAVSTTGVIDEESDGGTGGVPMASSGMPTTETTPAPAVTPPPGPATPKPRCADEPARAATASTRRDWAAVLRLTRKASCWPDRAERLRLRARALMLLGRYGECARLRTRSNDPELIRMANDCARLSKKTTP